MFLVRILLKKDNSIDPNSLVIKMTTINSINERLAIYYAAISQKLVDGNWLSSQMSGNSLSNQNKIELI